MYNTDGTQELKSFYDKQYSEQITFPSNQIDAIVGFFLKRGFEMEAARSTSITLLNQARLENVSPFELLDSLNGLDNLQLSQVVTKILNNYREKTSMLGYKIDVTDETFESRNIRP